MSELPVREMVLYKHGVGYFVRQGEVEGESIVLNFRKDEINDVLKSLAVFDRSGGQVLGIHYQTPMDKAARLASSSIRLSNDQSIPDLMRDLRGRLVSVTIERTPGSLEKLTGRVIGLSEEAQNPLVSEHGTSVEAKLSILIGTRQIHMYPLGSLRSIDIEDNQSKEDLSYFLDTSMSEDDRRGISVRLTEGEHDLFVSYVAPSPTWRVSYRVVAEMDDSGETGTALLQGWGLFDNRLEEDLTDVQVTLVAGQPISFIYELYASRIPKRPTVQDESRIAPGPIEYEAGEVFEDEEALLYRSVDTTAAGIVPPAPLAAKARSVARYAPSREEMQAAAPSAAEGQAKGEFFQYNVTAPVSVRRGESALVPIIGAEVKYERELLYNATKLPTHPVVALRFENTTDLTLERGPVTVVEDGDYKGEAVVPFTRGGTEVYLPYAVELGISVVESVETETAMAGMGLAGDYAIYESYQTRHKTYKFENTTAGQQTVTIEAPIDNAYKLFETREPDVTTLNERRWRVTISGHGKAEFVLTERRRLSRSKAIRDIGYADLDEIIKNEWLDQAVTRIFRKLLDTKARIVNAQAKLREIEDARKSIFSQQEQLRANMGALNPTGDEAAFRKRIVSQLEESQDRLDTLKSQEDELLAQIEAEELEAERILGLLTAR